MQALRLLSMIVLILCVLAGCSPDRARARLMKEHYPSYPELVKRAIDGGNVMRGMTHDQVYLALGPAYCKKPTQYQGKKVETWMYPPDEGMPCTHARNRVYFENGEVVGWDLLQSRF